MRIIAKKGTAFEQTVKVMYDRKKSAFSGACDIVEKLVGVRPIEIYHIFHWGVVSRLLSEFAFAPQDFSRINLKYLRRSKRDRWMWVPARRYKEGKELDDIFSRFAKDNELTDEPLHEFGIHMEDWKNDVSYVIRPAYDKDKDRYLLCCSDGIPRAFNKKKLAKDQFEIEY